MSDTIVSIASVATERGARYGKLLVKGLYNISSKNMHYALEAMLKDNAVKGLAHLYDAASDPVLTLTEAPQPIKSEGTAFASSQEEPKGVRPM